MKRMILAALLALTGLAGRAVVTQPQPAPGKWCTSISLAKEYAELHSMPFLAIWGSSGCGHCASLARALDTTEFRDWAASRNLVMCYGEDDDECKAFCKTGSQTLSLFPFVCVYWPKAGGRVEKHNFSGTSDLMPDQKATTLAGRLIASVEKYIKGYEYIDPSSGDVAFAAVGKEMALALNGLLYRKASCTVPLVAGTDAGRILEGTLAVSISAANRVSVKYLGSYGKTISMSGAWGTINTRDGSVRCTLSKGEVGCKACGQTAGGCSLVLTMDRDGLVSVELESGFSPLARTASGKAMLASPNLGKTALNVVFTSDDGLGTGYGTVTINGSKAAVKGVWADGASFSVSTVLSDDGEGNVVLPVFRALSKRVISAMLFLRESDGGLVAEEYRGVQAYAYSSSDGTLLCVRATGSEIETGLSPLAVCGLSGLDRDLVLHVGRLSVRVRATERGFELEEKTTVSSISYKKASLTFSGRAKLDDGSGNPVSATIKGALMTVSASGTMGFGTAYYKTRVDGKSVTVSVPVTIGVR